jgi:UDP-glucose 4-epimerase
MSAYGEPESLPTPETTPMLPETFYAVHKLASEHYLRIYAKEHGIKQTTFRLYTTYGHGQNLDNINQGLLSIYLAFIVQKETIIVKGSKERLRDIVHVSDVVNAIMMAIDNPNSYNKTYNLGSGESLKIGEIVDLLTTGMGYAQGEYPVTWEGSTQGDPSNTLASIQAVKDDIGWEPKVSPREGIRMTVANYNKV